MEFQPNPNDEITIDGVIYRVAEHPAAPGIAYGQEGRAGTVYRLEALTFTPRPGGHPPLPLLLAGEGEGGRGERVRVALKVFKPRFRLPFLVSQAERIAPFAALPGLSACQRIVLTPQRHSALLRQYPDLTYAVLMPWIEGPTWQEVLLEKRPLSPEQSLTLARGLADILSQMEQQGIAHCDLSAPNVMLPTLTLTPRPGGHPPLPLPLAGEGEGGRGERVRAPIELVDLEGLYAPGMLRPQELSSGSVGYAHRQAAGGLWGPDADRFAGAVLLAEMLGFCDPQAVDAAWGESYFDPQEMQQDSPRYRLLVDSLRRNWGDRVAGLFERAWRSDTLADCPTFGEWLAIVPEEVPPIVEVGSPAEVEVPLSSPEEMTRSQLGALMRAAGRLEEKGILDGALEVYRQAYELATGDPALASVAREIALVIQTIEKRQPLTPPPPPPTPPQAPEPSLTPPAQTSYLFPARKLFAAVLPFLRAIELKMIMGWILATLMGWSLYGAIYVSIFLTLGTRFWFLSSRTISSVSLVLMGALAGITGGTVMGIGQWWMLRPHIRRINGWIWTCVISLAAGGIARWALYGVTSVEEYYVICWAAIGAVVGAGQWLLLRPQIRYAGWWVPSQIIAFTTGWVIATEPTRWALYQIYLNMSSRMRPSSAPSVVGGMILGIMIVLWLRLVLHRHDHSSIWWAPLIIFGLMALGFLGDPIYRNVYKALPRAVRVDWSLYQAIIGVISGVIAGTGQWLLLRPHIRRATIWIPLTGFALAIVGGTVEEIYAALHLAIISPLYLVKNWTLYLVLYWAMVSTAIGLTVGIGIWSVSRQRVSGRDRWVGITIFGAAITGVLVGIIVRGIDVAIPWAAAGIIAGIPTGVAMMWLLQQAGVRRQER